jgi:hypothetical protein
MKQHTTVEATKDAEGFLHGGDYLFRRTVGDKPIAGRFRCEYTHGLRLFSALRHVSEGRYRNPAHVRNLALDANISVRSSQHP